MNLPIAFEEKMRELLGAEFDDYIKCYEEKRLYGLRVNTKKSVWKNLKRFVRLRFNRYHGLRMDFIMMESTCSRQSIHIILPDFFTYRSLVP